MLISVDGLQERYSHAGYSLSAIMPMEEQYYKSEDVTTINPLPDLARVRSRNHLKWTRICGKKYEVENAVTGPVEFGCYSTIPLMY